MLDGPGGLDTSAIIPWLKENYGCEVVAFAADVGQGDEELEGLHEKAIASGASECHIVDLKEEFVSKYIFPTITTVQFTKVNTYLVRQWHAPLSPKRKLRLRAK